MDPESGPSHRHNHYKEYLRWFHSVARVSVKPPLENVPIEDRADTNNDDDIVDEYDDITREGVQPERAPLHNYMVRQAIFFRSVSNSCLTPMFQAQQLGRLANEAGVAMAHASQGGNGGGHLRTFAEVN